MDVRKKTPKQLGYFFPAEWEPHEATWLSWPHKEGSWPGKIDKVFPSYSLFIKYLSNSEKVRINVADETMKAAAIQHLSNANVNLDAVEFYYHPTNDAWCRDHGPAFLVNRDASFMPQKLVLDWNYNAWGNKYTPVNLDDIIPTRIAECFDLPLYEPGIIMEGGSVDFNGKGTVLTTTACLLNKNRNPHLNQNQIEDYLKKYYGVQQVLWLGDGIAGDDTDGHIDDITRFVNEDTVVTVVEENPEDENYHILQENLQKLKEMKLLDGRKLQVIELPMPSPVIWEGTRLPASYANFYIANKAVIVPTYRDKNDEKALQILQECFAGRKVAGIDSTDIIWGLGSFHCLSQQEPAV